MKERPIDPAVRISLDDNTCQRTYTNLHKANLVYEARA